MIWCSPVTTGTICASARVHEDNMSWFAGAVKRAGVPRITPHDLRHSAASFAVSAGANVKVVQKMLGSQLGGHDAGHLRGPV